MHTKTLALTCLACAGYVQIVQTSIQELQSTSFAESPTWRKVVGERALHPLKVFVSFLQLLHPSAVFRYPSPGVHSLVGSPTHTGSEAMAFDGMSHHGLRRPLMQGPLMALSDEPENDIEMPKSADALQWQVLEARSRSLGPEHPDTLTCKSNIAQRLQARGDLKSAEGLLLDVLEVRLRTLGPDHPDTLKSKDSLAQTLQARGGLKAAEGLLMEVLNTRTRALGPEHPDTLTSKSNLAQNLQARGFVKNAMDLLHEVCGSRTSLLGSDHPDTLASKSKLAHIYQTLGDLKQAEGLLMEVMEANFRSLGSDHPETLASKSKFAQALQKRGGLGGHNSHTWA